MGSGGCPSIQRDADTGMFRCTKLGDPAVDPLGILGGSVSEKGDPDAIMTNKNGGIQRGRFPLI